MAAQEEDMGAQVLEEDQRMAMEDCDSLPSTSGRYSNLLSKYEIVARIGDGGQGEVYKVLRRSDGAQFACKTVEIHDERELHLLQQEIRVMQRLNRAHFDGSIRLIEVITDLGDSSISNHIDLSTNCTITDLSTNTTNDIDLGSSCNNKNSPVWHLVLELCACSLHDRIQSERGLSEREAAFLIKDLATTLQKLHGLGVVHRDLKPSNVLLTGESPPYNVKLADFGLSVAFKYRGIQLMKGCVGTPRYIAPEVLRAKFYDKRVDIWGLGLILYEALSGKIAFQGLHSDVVLERLCWADVPGDMLDFSGISVEIKELILGMLCLDPKKRFTAEGIVTHPWVVKNTEPVKSTVVKIRRVNGKWQMDRQHMRSICEEPCKVEMKRKRRVENDGLCKKLRFRYTDDLCQVVVAAS